MKRCIIIMDESGNIIMPDNVASIWMSEPELVELFGVIAPTLRASIRTIYKSGVLKKLPDGGSTCFPYQYFWCGTSAQCHS